MTIAVYHWWQEQEESPAYSNLAHPILLSIATLRAVNPTIPIKVVNCSKYFSDETKQSSDWIHFQEKLDFQTVGSDFALEQNYSHIVGYQLLSRIFDIRKQIHYPTMYCDSDVFWFRDPLPLACDINKFCFDGFNSGLFYYNPESPIVKEMFEVFDSYVITALRDQSFYNTIKQVTNYNAWPYIWDETILTYMNETGMDHMFEIVPPREHAFIRTLKDTNLDKIKMLHCNGLIIENPFAKRETEIRHCRGLACLLFKELYENICKVLDEKDLKMIFTEKELKNCLAHQFPLLEEYEKLEETRADDGHYVIQGTHFII